jgi:hypothetical protein
MAFVGTLRAVQAHSVPNHKGRETSLMARYSRSDIEALSNRLEVRASIMEASAGRDLMAAALLLRLMAILGDVQEIETVPRGGMNDGMRPC